MASHYGDHWPYLGSESGAHQGEEGGEAAVQESGKDFHVTYPNSRKKPLFTTGCGPSLDGQLVAPVVLSRRYCGAKRESPQKTEVGGLCRCAQANSAVSYFACVAHTQFHDGARRPFRGVRFEARHLFAVDERSP